MEDAASPRSNNLLVYDCFELLRSQSSCTFTVPSGVTLYVDLESDNWGGEIGLEITKPDGTTDSWAAGSFSRTQHTRFTSYSVAGQYTLKVTDTWGDGGANIAVYYGTSAGGYAGPQVENNTIGISAGRTAPNAVGLSFNDCDKVTIQRRTTLSPSVTTLWSSMAVTLLMLIHPSLEPVPHPLSVSHL